MENHVENAQANSANHSSTKEVPCKICGTLFQLSRRRGQLTTKTCSPQCTDILRSNSKLDASIWTQERTDTLIELRAQGVSASLIAERFGDGITRCAVLGKCNRLGLSKPAKSAKRKRRVRRPKLFNPLPVVPTPEPPPTIDDQLIPLAQRKTLFELTRWTCKWPVGNPGTADFFFCGALPIEGSPYCEAHCARAYNGFSGPSRRHFIFQVRKAA